MGRWRRGCGRDGERKKAEEDDAYPRANDVRVCIELIDLPLFKEIR